MEVTIENPAPASPHPRRQRLRAKLRLNFLYVPIMTDSGFRGADWLAHWAEAYGAQVCPKPQQASRAERRRWISARQVVETTLSHLTESFGLKYPGAHTGWGLLTRVAAKYEVEVSSGWLEER